MPDYGTVPTGVDPDLQNRVNQGLISQEAADAQARGDTEAAAAAPKPGTQPPAAQPIPSPQPTPQAKAAAILRLEAAGQLNEAQQAALDRLRKANQFPTVDIDPSDPTFAAAEHQHGLPEGTLRGLYAAENAGKGSGATSPTGVKGLLQVTLGTGAKYGLTETNRTNPYKNLDVAASYMADLLKEHKGNLDDALVKGYKGHGAVDASDEAYLARFHKGMHGDIYAGPEPAAGGEPIAGAPSPAPEEGAPGTTIFPTPSGREQAQNALDMVKRGAQAALYDGLVFPANELNRLGYSLDIPGFKPPADHIAEFAQSDLGQLVGRENLSHLDANTPAGFWGRVGAAAGTLESTYAPTFGAYVAARTFGADEAVARGMESVVGGLAFIHEATKVVANRAAFRRIGEVVKEGAYKVGLARERAATAVPAAQAEVDQAQLALKTARDARIAGVQQAAQQQKDLNAAAAAKGATAKIEITNHTAGGPTDLVEFGESLQEPGKGILPQAAKRLGKRTNAAYERWKAVGTEGGLELPSAESSAQRRDMADTVQEIGQLARTDAATPAERAIAQEISDTLTPSLPTGTREAVQRALEEGRGHKLTTPQSPPVPIAKLIDLKSALGKVALSPQDYPVLRSRLGRLLTGKLGAQLDNALRSLSVGHPEVEVASQEARQLAREQFAFRKTVKKLLRAETPEAAAEALFSPRYPSRLLRLMREASPAEVIAIQKAHLSDIYKTSMDAAGNPDFTAALKAWNKVPQRSRRLISPVGSPEAQTALMEMLSSRRVNLDHAALADAESRTTALLRDLSAAQKAAEEAPVEEVLGKASAEELKAATRLSAAQRNLDKANQIVTKAEDAAKTKVLEFKRTGGARPGGFGSMMARRAAITLAFAPFLGGVNTRSAVTSAAWVHLMLVYPKYVRAAIRTPLNTEHGLRMAKAMAGILNGYYGRSDAERQANAQRGSAPASPTPPAAPAP